MPTVQGSIQITIKDATSALPNPTFGELIVIGEDTVDWAKFNTVFTFFSQAEAEAEFALPSPISKATAKIFAQGADKVKAVNVIEDGIGTKDYAEVLNDLQTNEVDYDIIVPTIDASDANAPTLVTHADTYNKVLVISELDTATNVVAAFGALTPSEWVYAVAHDDSGTYTPAEMSGAAAGAIANVESWIPAEWQSVIGINVAGYTPSEISTIETANANTLINVGNSIVLSGGKALDGSWLDVSRTKQYLEALIETDLANMKLRKAGAGQKIPYTPAGLGLINSTLVKSCKTGQDAGAIREDSIDGDNNFVPGFTVVVPSFDSISQGDKDVRTLNNVVVTAYLSGAISIIKLDLVITL